LNDHRIIDGRAVQQKLLGEIAGFVENLTQEKPIGRLVSVSIGDVAEVDVYIRNQERAAAKVGIPFERLAWPEAITQAEAKAQLVSMNDDPTPCTAAAAVELIRETGLDMKGLEIVMVGHSEIVGKPAAMMLMAEGATVTVCHHMTRSVAMHSRRADVVVVAVGKAHLIGADMVKPGAAVIDIGINQITDEEGKTRIVGDVDTDAVKEVASWITPVPGGVGPVTVAILMRNAARSWERQLEMGWV